MSSSRRTFLAAAAGAAAWSCTSGPEDDGLTRYVRFERAGEVSYGLLRGDRIQPIEGDLFGSRAPAGETLPLSEVKLLAPVEPTKILALAGNYRSHIGEDAELPEHPEPFYKPISSLVGPGDEIVFPPGAQDVHYEAELVIVISKKCKNVPLDQVDSHILGYTCGNDVSERNWQNGSIDGAENKDLQWWRGKGCDTFAPIGPVITAGLDVGNSRIELRLNGEVKQEATFDMLIHKPREVVAFISKYVTLLPGDLIFTGTSGKTSPLSPGDVVEVEIDGIGTLSNTVAG